MDRDIYKEIQRNTLKLKEIMDSEQKCVAFVITGCRVGGKETVERTVRLADGRTDGRTGGQAGGRTGGWTGGRTNRDGMNLFCVNLRPTCSRTRMHRVGGGGGGGEVFEEVERRTEFGVNERRNAWSAQLLTILHHSRAIRSADCLQYIHSFVIPFVRQSVSQSVRSFVRPSVCLFVCLSVRLSVCLSVCPTICSFFCSSV